MSYLDHDSELPAGFQEADILQASYEAQSRQARRDREAGICHHSWRLGGKVPAIYTAENIAEDRQKGHFPERVTDARVTDQASIPEGRSLCLDCGLLVHDR